MSDLSHIRLSAGPAVLNESAEEAGLYEGGQEWTAAFRALADLLEEADL